MKKTFSVLVNKKIEKFNKKIEIPSDKSCSIRAILFASQCIGVSKIKKLSESEDVLNCVNALKTLGVKIVKKKNIYFIWGNGLNSFKVKKKLTRIYIGNSLTTGRLLAGLLSTFPSKFYLYGDESANSRDFTRVIKPLEKIGAFFSPRKKTLPLSITGTAFPLAQKHIEDKGSSQVKSLILFAALSTSGITTVEEKKDTTRNHTELFLKRIGADIKIKKLKKGNLISLRGQQNFHAFNYRVGADPSSSAFLLVLALISQESKLIIPKVICNDSRIGFIQVLKKMNANIKIKNLRRDPDSGELLGTIVASSSKLKPVNVSKDVAKFIDELPLLFICASLAKGVSKFKNVQELVHKESNRLLEVKKILIQAGVKCKITKNSMTVYGKDKIETQNKSILVNCDGDHRINMVACIYSLGTGIKTKIKNFETVNTSFPGFISLIKNLGAKIEIKKN